jgi:hypothetical protein
MTAKCGSCYWNVTLPGCTGDRMVHMGDDCHEYRPAKLYEHGRPRGGRGGA